MKKVKILSFVLAVLMLAMCFVACEKEETDGPKAGNTMKIKVGVYTTFDPKTMEVYTEDAAILGALEGIDVAPNAEGKVTVIEVVSALATARKAKFTPTTSGVDSIEFDNITYQTGKNLNTKEKKTADGKEVYFYEMFSWEYSVNGAAAEMDTPLKNGDSINLKFVKTVLSEYKTVADYEANK